MKNVFSVRAPVDSLPEPIRKLLYLLGGEEEQKIALTGGMARFVLLKSLANQGKFINPAWLNEAAKLTDVDIKIGHYDSLPRSREEVIQRAAAIEERLKVVLAENVLKLDFDTMNFSGRDGIASERTISTLLGNMDVTVDEVVLMPRNGVWYLYYTPRCWKHTLEGVGILTAKNVRREKNGITVPNSLALYRLARIFAAGKVAKAVIPKYLLDLYSENVNRLQKQRKLSKGANLGHYSLALVQSVKDNAPAQRRLMQFLSSLEMTKETNFEVWASAQEVLGRFGCNGRLFNFRNIPFAEKVERKIAFIRKKEDQQMKKKKIRDTCNHN
ncbi:MAG: hypothetical protein ABH919_02840, partial [bacterium]